MNFIEKNAFITGAGKGIGRAIALGLAKQGVNLVLIDIHEENLNATTKMATDLGVKVLPLIIDISDELAMRNAVNQAIKAFGQIHILINNAAIMPVTEFEKTTSDDWKRVINVNILGTMYPTHALLPHMIANGYGRIINIASVAGHYGIGYFVDYSMSKGAVISFTKALAKAVTDKGITVNCVSPGGIDASFHGDYQACDLSYMGRWGTPDECAALIIFLASEEANYISGQNYLIDGCRKII